MICMGKQCCSQCVFYVYLLQDSLFILFHAMITKINCLVGHYLKKREIGSFNYIEKRMLNSLEYQLPEIMELHPP